MNHNYTVKVDEELFEKYNCLRFCKYCGGPTYTFPLPPFYANVNYFNIEYCYDCKKVLNQIYQGFNNNEPEEIVEANKTIQ